MQDIVSMEKGLMNLMYKQLKDYPDYKLPAVLYEEEAFADFITYKFRKIVSYAYNKSKYYKEIFDRAGLKPEDIRGLEDIKKLPYTEPQDLAQRPYDFLCVSQSDVSRIITFTSSGTVGPKKRIFFSEKDIETITDFLGVGMNTVAAIDEAVQILLPEGPVMGQADLLKKGIEKKGFKAVIAGMFMPSEEQIEKIIKYRPAVIFGETRLIYRITKETEDKYDLKRLGLKCIFVTTSYISDIMRKNLENAYGCKVCTHYGLTEMGLGLAVECLKIRKYHFNELDVYAEIVDPITGEVLPDGEEGELVFTTLTRQAMPLIRYRSHDFATMSRKKCICGTFLKTIGQVNRRRESIVKLINGKEIYPAMFDDVMFYNPDIIDYDIYINRKDKAEKIIFKVEVKNSSKSKAEDIKIFINNSEILKNIFGQPLIEIEVEILPQGSLKQGIHFKKMIRLI